MECQDVRQLLAFVGRKNDELDAAERVAMQQHLEKCPDCADLAQAERGFDESVGAVLRDVPVPADLKQKVMKRLAAGRAPAWKGMAKLAAAAAILVGIAGGTWYYLSPRNVPHSAADQIFVIQQWDKETAEQFLKDQGLVGPLPEVFDYRFFQSVEVVEFMGHHVAKLRFSRPGESAATVLILPKKQFRTDDVIEDPTRIQLLHDEANTVTYLIRVQGSLRALQKVFDGA